MTPCDQCCEFVKEFDSLRESLQDWARRLAVDGDHRPCPDIGADACCRKCTVWRRHFQYLVGYVHDWVRVTSKAVNLNANELPEGTSAEGNCSTPQHVDPQYRQHLRLGSNLTCRSNCCDESLETNLPIDRICNGFGGCSLSLDKSVSDAMQPNLGTERSSMNKSYEASINSAEHCSIFPWSSSAQRLRTFNPQSAEDQSFCDLSNLSDTAGQRSQLKYSSDYCLKNSRISHSNYNYIANLSSSSSLSQPSCQFASGDVATEHLKSRNDRSCTNVEFPFPVLPSISVSEQPVNFSATSRGLRSGHQHISQAPFTSIDHHGSRMISGSAIASPNSIRKSFPLVSVDQSDHDASKFYQQGGGLNNPSGSKHFAEYPPNLNYEYQNVVFVSSPIYSYSNCSPRSNFARAFDYDSYQLKVSNAQMFTPNKVDALVSSTRTYFGSPGTLKSSTTGASNPSYGTPKDVPMTSPLEQAVVAVNASGKEFPSVPSFVGEAAVNDSGLNHHFNGLRKSFPELGKSFDVRSGEVMACDEVRTELTCDDVGVNKVSVENRPPILRKGPTTSMASSFVSTVTTSCCDAEQGRNRDINVMDDDDDDSAIVTQPFLDTSNLCQSRYFEFNYQSALDDSGFDVGESTGASDLVHHFKKDMSRAFENCRKTILQISDPIDGAPDTSVTVGGCPENVRDHRPNDITSASMRKIPITIDRNCPILNDLLNSPVQLPLNGGYDDFASICDQATMASNDTNDSMPQLELEVSVHGDNSGDKFDLDSSNENCPPPVLAHMGGELDCCLETGVVCDGLGTSVGIALEDSVTVASVNIDNNSNISPMKASKSLLDTRSFNRKICVKRKLVADWLTRSASNLDKFEFGVDPRSEKCMRLSSQSESMESSWFNPNQQLNVAVTALQFRLQKLLNGKPKSSSSVASVSNYCKTVYSAANSLFSSFDNLSLPTSLLSSDSPLECLYADSENLSELSAAALDLINIPASALLSQSNTGNCCNFTNDSNSELLDTETHNFVIDPSLEQCENDSVLMHNCYPEICDDNLATAIGDGIASTGAFCDLADQSGRGVIWEWGDSDISTIIGDRSVVYDDVLSDNVDLTMHNSDNHVALETNVDHYSTTNAAYLNHSTTAVQVFSDNSQRNYGSRIETECTDQVERNSSLPVIGPLVHTVVERSGVNAFMSPGSQWEFTGESHCNSAQSLLAPSGCADIVCNLFVPTDSLNIVTVSKNISPMRCSLLSEVDTARKLPQNRFRKILPKPSKDNLPGETIIKPAPLCSKLSTALVAPSTWTPRGDLSRPSKKKSSPNSALSAVQQKLKVKNTSSKRVKKNFNCWGNPNGAIGSDERYSEIKNTRVKNNDLVKNLNDNSIDVIHVRLSALESSQLFRSRTRCCLGLGQVGKFTTYADTTPGSNPAEPLFFICKLCRKPISDGSMKSGLDHVELEHRIGDSLFLKCPLKECGASFEVPKDMLNHVNSNHPDD